MTRPLAPRRLAALLLLLAPLACGGGQDETPPPPAKADEPAASDTKIEAKAPVDDGKAPEDPFADDVWDEPADEGDGGEQTPPTPPSAPAEPTGPFPGPCKVTWKGGPTVRMAYTEAGGTVRVDDDADGKADVCGKFETKDGKTTKVSVDVDCDKKTDMRIEPSYDGASNLAGAKVTNADKSTEQITLVVLPGFVGIQPGYTIAAAREAVTTKLKDGRVIEARADDPAVKLTIAYDKDGRAKSVSEDLAADGSVDRKFTYKYDPKGNVSRIDVTVQPAAGDDGKKPKAIKQTAKLDYACWK